jgi:hypothetical protein
MFVAMVVLNWVHPGEVAVYNRELKGKNSDRDAETAYEHLPMVPERNT